MNKEQPQNPYNMSTTPKNSWELFKWFFSEPIKLEKFSQNLSIKQSLYWYIKVVPWIVLVVLFVFILSNLTVAWFDLPTYYPQYFKEIITKEWHNIHGFESKLHYLINIRLYSLVILLALGLVVGLVAMGLRGLVMGLVMGLIGGLVGDLVRHVAFNLTFSIVFSIGLGLLKDSTRALAVSTGLSTQGSIEFGLTGGLLIALSFIVSFTFVLLGLHSYFYHLTKYQFIHPSLQKNPYLHDSFVFFPIFGMKKALYDDAFANPTNAKQFIAFLFEFRPYQRQLAFELSNIVDASLFYNHPLAQNTIMIPKDYEKHQPTDSFIDHLTQYQNELNTYHTQNNLHYKKESLQTIIETLAKLEEDMIKETRDWREYYLKAIRKNLEVANSEFKSLEDRLKSNEPIQANIYRVGEPLSPLDKTSTFKGREDMKDALSRAVLTRGTMPLLFIQGQRRVGKTSLINYLEVLLGSGFKIVKIDMQKAQNKKFINLLKNLNREINAKLRIDEVVDFGGDTNDNWVAFEEYLERHTSTLNYKFIIAFDEYESFHTNIAQKEPEILGYMRGFLQHQEQVIFLFAGLRDIAELTMPNWDEYFPQIQKLRVDYLSSVDSKELITHPVPNFGLIYDSGVVGEMIELTQGHPQLLQTICSIIVDSANAKGTKNIHQAIIEEAKGKIFQTNEAPMSIFWREYCDDTQRAIVEEIIAHKPITQDTKKQKRALLRLKEYGFITGANQIRVPLFEKWLIERRELIEIPSNQQGD